LVLFVKSVADGTTADVLASTPGEDVDGSSFEGFGVSDGRLPQETEPQAKPHARSKAAAA
jgi:hypothetical protein